MCDKEQTIVVVIQDLQSFNLTKISVIGVSSDRRTEVLFESQLFKRSQLESN